jgi:hypothetical protein
VGKSSPQIWATSVIFKITFQSEQSSNRRKIARYGHTDSTPGTVAVVKSALALDGVVQGAVERRLRAVVGGLDHEGEERVQAAQPGVAGVKVSGEFRLYHACTKNGKHFYYLKNDLLEHQTFQKEMGKERLQLRFGV